MSRRGQRFEHLKLYDVASTTQNILRHNSKAVKVVVMKDGQPTTINATAPMNPAKAQRIAASLHATKH